MIYATPDQNPLSPDEESKFLAFKADLQEKEKEGKVLFLYRGVSYNHFTDLISRSAKEPLDEIFGRVFVVGEKARYYSEGLADESSYLTTINDVSEETFKYIFQRILNILSSRKLSKRRDEHISDSFKTFFTTPENRSFFLDTIKGLDFDKKLAIRDYYLYLLHTSGEDGVKRETFFVSTSAKRRVAKFFSTKKEREKRLILHYFVPRPFNVHVIAPWMLNDSFNQVSDLGLPTYNPTGLFPEQKEISVKGALFGIFIIGVELLHEGLFLVNPNIFRVPDAFSGLPAYLGIPPAKESFDDNILQTVYKGFVSTDCSGNFNDQPLKL